MGEHHTACCGSQNTVFPNTKLNYRTGLVMEMALLTGQSMAPVSTGEELFLFSQQILTSLVTSYFFISQLQTTLAQQKGASPKSKYIAYLTLTKAYDPCTLT